MIATAERLVDANGLSSAHATFIHEAELPIFEKAGWLIRTDSQFHWLNEDYGSFDDFLAALSSRKRKAIRKERAAAREGLEIVHLTGADLTEAHWDAFWAFYQDTGARKWGRPYLTRAFFSLLGERLAERRLHLEVTDLARAWLASHGYDPVYGARPLRRLLQTAIGDPLAKALLAGEIRDGDTVLVDRPASGDALTVTRRP